MSYSNRISVYHTNAIDYSFYYIHICFVARVRQRSYGFIYHLETEKGNSDTSSKIIERSYPGVISDPSKDISLTDTIC